MAALAGLAFAAVQSKTLRLNVEPETTYTYTSTSETTTNIGGMMAGSEEEAVTTSESIMSIAYGEQTEGDWLSVTVTYTDMEVDMEGGGMMMQMMGGLPDPDELESTGFSAEVNPRAQVRNLELINADDLEDVNASTLKAYAGMMEELGFMGAFYPEEPLEVGTSWTRTIDLANLTGMGEMMMIQSASGEAPVTFTVTGFETMDGREVVTMDVEMDGSMTFTVDAGGAPMTGNMGLESVGTAHVLVDSGMLYMAEQTTTTNMDMSDGMVVVDTVTSGTTKLNVDEE
jgi:hypothetical protein